MTAEQALAAVTVCGLAVCAAALAVRCWLDRAITDATHLP